MSANDTTHEADGSSSVLAELRALRLYLETNLIGVWENGVFRPGLAPQVADHTKRILALEHRKVWWRDQGLPILISLAALAASAWQAIQGGK